MNKRQAKKNAHKTIGLSYHEKRKRDRHMHEASYQRNRAGFWILGPHSPAYRYPNRARVKTWLRHRTKSAFTETSWSMED